MTNKTAVDITPSPRILQVLGEIEFKPWQCVAELIDNAIDEFLKMKRAGTPIQNPTVSVAFGRDTVVVKDNGPGMSLDDLELAVKAGWTKNERFGSLGLYGVGFNIATARLGYMTRIWTTRSGDPTWYGLEIDLQKMAKGQNYSLEVKSRTKSDPYSSGTEIEVSKIKQDWKDLLAKENWVRQNITEKLARIYGAMLRATNPQPISFLLRVNDRNVSAWEHCVWPADMEVYRKNEGNVRPIQEFNVLFGKKYLSRSTNEIFDMPPEGLAEDDVIEIQERVYGWIGIQRYADETDFGVDILRNGRKIEVACKDIFTWEDANGRVITEYPIDDPRNRGRIVGEIHLDHGYVHYTKDRFEREHSSWKQLLSAVRNNEPLTNRERQGCTGVNESHLGILHRTFRRNSPLSNKKENQSAWKDLLFIKDNDTAKKWAEKYRKGEAEYREDDKWRQELEKDNPSQPLRASQGNDSGQINILEIDGQDNDPILGVSDNHADDINSDIDSGEDSSAVQPPQVRRTLMPELSLNITGIGASGKSYDVEVYAVEASRTTSNPPWQSRATARGVYEIDINLEHPAFNSTSLQVRDAVLAEVAYIITSEEAANLGAIGRVNYADILVALRNRYSVMDSLEPNRLRLEIDELRKRLTKCLSKIFPGGEHQPLFEALPQEDIQRIELAQARRTGTVSIIDYLEMRHLADLLQRRPALLFEAGCFNQPWTPPTLAENPALLEEYRKPLLRDLQRIPGL
ncbi:ATP-binding protein [Microcoleus vaginatus DQ-U2]|uniref:ATP-binding protein n=1 Tax=Microcoleus vaginatus TaxID=119532 RepID=UPI0016862894|nr:ATP-binding protein [Microcoleus sp. FACHB-DQ6]